MILTANLKMSNYILFRPTSLVLILKASIWVVNLQAIVSTALAILSTIIYNFMYNDTILLD